MRVFKVDRESEAIQIKDEDKVNGKVLGMMLPYFITILLFAGAMGLGVDMITGEKERGTMASLLVTPVKRSSIVLGKVFALMALTGISSVIYVAAMVACMPIMAKTMGGNIGDGFKISMDVKQIIMLGALLIALSFLYSTLIALVSDFCKINERGKQLYYADVHVDSCYRTVNDVFIWKYAGKFLLDSGL